MHINRRTGMGVGVLLLLGVFVLLARRHDDYQAVPTASEGSVVVAVTNRADRGPGSLREALFLGAGARGDATILIRVDHISVETALPPLANTHGVSITAQDLGTVIDAKALEGGAVFDVASENASITGVTVRNCPAAAVLLHAARFHLVSSTIESCDVGVDVAENARDFRIERNRFSKNRVGVRLTASNPGATLEHNEFTADADAGVWAVRGALDVPGTAPVAVRSNKFVNDRVGIVAGNVSLLVEDNDLTRSRESAVHLVGAGVTVRGNRVHGGEAMGIVAENARDATIEKNELEHLTAYGIMVRGSANTTVRGNRIYSCGYGLAFVLGDSAHPSTAVDNTLFALRYDGIDVIGDSPVLRRNRVQAGVAPLHTEDFQRPGQQRIGSKPFLDDNTFAHVEATVAARDGERPAAGAAPR